jgi:hypothetical protein
VTVKDDGKDGAAGWKDAEKTFRFVETTFLLPVYHWQCPTRIEMPVRCEEWGRILPDRAAQLTADATNAVVDPFLESGVVWRNRGDELCRELWHQMEMGKARFTVAGLAPGKPSWFRVTAFLRDGTSQQHVTGAPLIVR